MKKILHPFDMNFSYGRPSFYPVYIVIEDREPDNYLSFTGVEAPNRFGSCKGGCGQIVMGYDHKDKSQNDTRYHNYLITIDQLRFTKGWDAETWYQVLNLWELYHLKNISEVPADIIDWIKNLPNTDRTPAWC